MCYIVFLSEEGHFWKLPIVNAYESQTFQTIMLVYPVSLAATAVLIGIALLVYRPSRRLEKKAV